MVLFIFFLLALLKLAFIGTPDALAWFRPGLPLLSNLAGPIQHFKAALLDAWRNKVTADLCGRKGFREVLFLTFMVLCSSFILLMFEKEDKALLRTILVGGVWNGFLLGYVRGQTVPCRFCGAPDHDGHFFGENVLFFPSLRFVKILSFTIS